MAHFGNIRLRNIPSGRLGDPNAVIQTDDSNNRFAAAEDLARHMDS